MEVRTVSEDELEPCNCPECGSDNVLTAPRYIIRWRNSPRAPVQSVYLDTDLASAMEYATAILDQRDVDVAVIEDDSLVCIVSPDQEVPA